nr:metallophosphoesterase [Lachnospiraceae bacterium]
GLVRLPFIGGLVSPKLNKPKYDKGLFKGRRAYLYVSAGLGSHTIFARFMNCTEVNFITIKE